MMRHDSCACFYNMPIEFDINANRRYMNFILRRHWRRMGYDFYVM